MKVTLEKLPASQIGFDIQVVVCAKYRRFVGNHLADNHTAAAAGLDAVETAANGLRFGVE